MCSAIVRKLISATRAYLTQDYHNKWEYPPKREIEKRFYDKSLKNGFVIKYIPRSPISTPAPLRNQLLLFCQD
jgi:hypothetical protein